MPFIHVKSLPFEPPLDIPAVVEGITNDFARDSGIALEHVTATWEYMLPGAYAVAGKAASIQPKTLHPILVDVLVPDFNGIEAIERMLKAVAQSIAQRSGVPVANIFINLRQAHAGMVFDAGEVVRW